MEPHIAPQTSHKTWLRRCAGVNNAYLVTVRHELALVYNDASVLENRHLAAMYGLLAGRPEADVLAAVEPARWRELRRMVINAVIHTDMVHHFPLVSKARPPWLQSRRAP